MEIRVGCQRFEDELNAGKTNLMFSCNKKHRVDEKSESGISNFQPVYHCRVTPTQTVFLSFEVNK